MKRTYRLYTQAGLAMRRRSRQRLVRGPMASARLARPGPGVGDGLSMEGQPNAGMVPILSAAESAIHNLFSNNRRKGWFI